MFDELRSAFREAIENFNKELNREQVPETVDKLIKGMIDEVAAAKADIGELELQIQKTVSRLDKERADLATCRRREQMANGIGDTETAEVAASYAVKHEAHVQVLEQKLTALKAELAFREKSVEEMMAKIQEARTKRESLSATAGRTGARESLSAADDLFAELDRMADKISGERAEADAAESLSDLDLESHSEYHIDLDEPAPRVEPDYDARLAELKRRMKQED